MSFKQEQQLIGNAMNEDMKQKRKDMLSLFSEIIKSVDPYNAVSSYLKKSQIMLPNQTIDSSQFDNIFVVGFGKGSVGMTQAVCDHLVVNNGVAITNQVDKIVTSDNVETIVGGHPLPNEQSILGAKKVQSLLSNCEINDLVIILISGGGSALLAAPRISLDELQQTTKLLLASGATIQEINTIRKHVSMVKGGQLVKSLPCKVITFIVSDVVGDPLEFIASGPTVGDSTTFTDAYHVLQKYELWGKIPKSVQRVIEQGKNGLIPDTPSPSDPVFSQVSNHIVANNSMACETAFAHAKRLGYDPVVLSLNVTGEARQLGPQLFNKALNVHSKEGGTIFISGGEPTVTIQGSGKGGRNQELVLSLVESLSSTNHVFGSFGTDGIDGMSPAAGAIADGKTLERAKKRKLDPFLFLENNDSYTFFSELNDVLVTGPTGTNVMDVHILII